VPDRPGVAAGIFGPLAETSINVDLIVQNVSADGKQTDITFTVAQADYDRALGMIEAARTLGNRMSDPFMVMSFMGLEVIPKLKLTDMGLVDVEQFKLLDLFV